ncbi:hypothetical protein BaRGS_00004115, partial [Batillaria attramentaria]
KLSDETENTGGAHQAYAGEDKQDEGAPAEERTFQEAAILLPASGDRRGNHCWQLYVLSLLLEVLSQCLAVLSCHKLLEK